MKKIKLVNKKNGSVVSAQVAEARSFFERLKGLMFDEGMSEFDGLLIIPCNSIHTFFMRFNIDVIFLDKNFKVVKIIKNLAPWRMTRFYFSAFQVLEMKGGSLASDVEEGDSFEVICLS